MSQYLPALFTLCVLARLTLSGTVLAQPAVLSEEGYLPKQTATVLCAAYHDDPKNERLAKELQRRHAFTEIDRNALSKHVPVIGMSECGLFALSGFPEKIMLNYQDNPYETVFHQIAYFYRMADAQSVLVVGFDNGAVSYLHSAIE
jgi:hypothetical protein